MTARICFASLMMAALASPSFAETLTIATVNNGDMIRMQKLSADFSRKHPDINLNWVTLDEADLRQQVTIDIATNGGKFDVLTIGTYEVPIWANEGWLLPLDDLGTEYDTADILPAIRDSLTHNQSLFAVPFYGESSMVMYRQDLMAKAGLLMPPAPTWSFIADAAIKMTDRAAGVNGICLRGKPGWGENMAFLTATANSFGARWFDEKWQPQFNHPTWKQTLNFYVDLIKKAGPESAEKNGFNENLSLFQAGKCGMWIDATVAASFVSDPKASSVAAQVGFALAPDNGLGRRANWLWAWNLAIPASTAKSESAKAFLKWATDKRYAQLVAKTDGWANVPPGTRSSLYQNTAYQAAAPFAKMTLESINAADPLKPSVDPVPYVGVQFVAIQEFQGIGDEVGKQFAKALEGAVSVDEALTAAQAVSQREMRKAKYIEPGL
ncbi:ABC transporter substrate-binding protein [Rhizobium panacihumi]|uniref:ABC transporter substrate-binding protein n=1 Tax=Rhizobium panacihumi TaxID=2008450 RepID=UPI003D79C6D4